MTLHRPFASVLIANRGEIAARIVREAKALGLRVIAVYSDVDRRALWVDEADAAIRIGPAPARDSYLNSAAILAAAKQTDAEAIHPGYGFLAENPDFAQSVIDAGLVWIGPSPGAIRAMGDKGNAKAIARKADVPVIPGYDGDDQSDARLLAEAKKIGWPILIKAALGGGGRGQRRVTQEADFADALASACREAHSAFASDRVILEKALDNVRHVEVQVFGDAHGNIIHLGERDCSLQRRNQKIIEEAPAPGVSEDLRTRMGEAAVRLARAVDYANAGTVEFLLDRDGQFYFLEMNTRIQVEHPVTEEVTGTNMIQWQFDVARGKPLPLTQSDVKIKGHAIEARLCAEDPADGFRPHLGEIGIFNRHAVDCRVDQGIRSGSVITDNYDSMIAKVIAKGPDRDTARRALIEALVNLDVIGLRTNRAFLTELLRNKEVTSGAVDIAWLERQPPFRDNNIDGAAARIAALDLAHGQAAGWSSTGTRRTMVTLRERDKTRTFMVENAKTGDTTLIAAGRPHRGNLHDIVVDQAGTRVRSTVVSHNGWIHVDVNRGATVALFEDVTYAPAEPKGTAGANVVRAPMAGRIVKVMAEPRAKVAKSQVLVILEAMKMEHELRAAADGVVETVTAKPGDQVAIRQTLVTLAAQIEGR
jgi:geranyl-CoA carboxylase alpha subunit